MGLGLGLGELFDNPWLGVTLVGLVVVIAGVVMLRGGLAALKKVDPTPERTIQTLKEDKEWLKNPTS